MANTTNQTVILQQFTPPTHLSYLLAHSLAFLSLNLLTLPHCSLCFIDFCLPLSSLCTIRLSHALLSHVPQTAPVQGLLLTCLTTSCPRLKTCWIFFWFIEILWTRAEINVLWRLLVNFPQVQGLIVPQQCFLCLPSASQGIIIINQEACFFITSHNGHCMFGTYWLGIGSTCPFINHAAARLPVFNICLSRAGRITQGCLEAAWNGQDSLRQGEVRHMVSNQF